MFKKFIMAAALAVAVTFTAQADSIVGKTALASTLLIQTNSITSAATSNYTATASLEGCAGYGVVQVGFGLVGAGTGDVVANFAYSVDGVNFETTPSLSVTNSGNGAAMVYGVASFTPKVAKSIKLVSITNGGGANATNVSVRVGILVNQ